MLKSVITALTTTLLLSGCSPTLINAGAPDVVEYPPKVQEQVAAEVQRNYCPASTELLKDYLVTRDQARVSNATGHSQAPQ